MGCGQQIKKKGDENDENIQNSEYWDNLVGSCGKKNYENVDLNQKLEVNMLTMQNLLFTSSTYVQEFYPIHIPFYLFFLEKSYFH